MPAAQRDSFGAVSTLSTSAGNVDVHRLTALADAGVGQIDRLPFSIKVLLESVLRNLDGFTVTEDDVRTLAAWDGSYRARLVARRS